MPPEDYAPQNSLSTFWQQHPLRRQQPQPTSTVQNMDRKLINFEVSIDESSSVSEETCNSDSSTSTAKAPSPLKQKLPSSLIIFPVEAMLASTSSSPSGEVLTNTSSSPNEEMLTKTSSSLNEEMLTKTSSSHGEEMPTSSSTPGNEDTPIRTSFTVKTNRSTSTTSNVTGKGTRTSSSANEELLPKISSAGEEIPIKTTSSLSESLLLLQLLDFSSVDEEDPTNTSSDGKEIPTNKPSSSVRDEELTSTSSLANEELIANSSSSTNGNEPASSTDKPATNNPEYKALDFEKYDYAKFATTQEAMEALFDPPYPDPDDPLTKLIVDIHLVTIEWGNQLEKEPRDQEKCDEQSEILASLGAQINRENVERINPKLVRWMMNHGFLNIANVLPSFH